MTDGGLYSAPKVTIFKVQVQSVLKTAVGALPSDVR